MKSTKRVIMLTGANGQVGFELARSLQGLGTVVSLDRQALDMRNLNLVRDTVRAIKPHLIVNPAAYTAVDKAEVEVDAATRLNAEVPGVLAAEAKKLNAALIHYSTDYVFDGSKDGAYMEDDTPCPLNVYGRTKLAGEQAIAASGCAHLIFRTSWIYGMRGKNFLLTMLRLGAERQELSVVADQIGAPTWSVSIAAATANVLAQTIVQEHDQWWQAHSGIYHLAAAGETSWYGFAKAIFAHTDLPYKPMLKPISASAYLTPAIRPANSRLSNAKLRSVFGIHMPTWDVALRLCLFNKT